MTLTLGHFLSLGAMLFALSVIGIFLNRKNLIILLMAIELMLLAVNMNFVAFSYYLNLPLGWLFLCCCSEINPASTLMNSTRLKARNEALTLITSCICCSSRAAYRPRGGLTAS